MIRVGYQIGTSRIRFAYVVRRTGTNWFLMDNGDSVHRNDFRMGSVAAALELAIERRRCRPAIAATSTRDASYV